MSEGMVVPPKHCVWCDELFTPTKRRAGLKWTIACCPTHAKRWSGSRAKQPGGSLERALAARQAKCRARIEARLGALSPVEAYRLGMKRGYQRGYARLPMERE